MRFTVIFDMDGVLVDSLPHLVPSYNRYLCRFGVTLTAEQFKPHHGRKIRDIVGEFNKLFSLEIDFEEFKSVVDAYQYEMMRSSQRSYGREQLLLSGLRERGVPIAVATSSSRPRAERLLALCGYAGFDAIVTGSEVARGKPAPDLFLRAAKELGIAPERCVVCEDAPNGLAAARSGGMKAVGIASQNHTRAELEPLADLVVESLGDLSYEKLNALFQE